MRVRLIGVPRIEGPDGDVREVRGNKPWAVLARLLLADQPTTRRALSAELFPDTDDPLGSLRWCLAALRKAIGSSDLFTGDPVSVALPPDVTVDVLDLQAGGFEEVGVGGLLDGVDVTAGREFSTWLLVAREHLTARVSDLQREATITALSRAQYDVAVRLAERAARRSPLDEGAQVLLVKSLAMAGRPRAAAAHAMSVEQYFRAELGCEPSPALRSAARAGIAASPPGVSASTLASSLLDAGPRRAGGGCRRGGTGLPAPGRGTGRDPPATRHCSGRACSSWAPRSSTRSAGSTTRGASCSGRPPSRRSPPGTCARRSPPCRNGATPTP